MFVEGNAVGVGRGGLGEGALHFAGYQGAFDDYTHFGIEACGAWVEVEGADKDTLSVDDEGFGMKAGNGAAGQPFVFGGRNGMIGLQFVKFDAGVKQGFAVFGVTGVDGGNIGSLQRVGQDGYTYAVLNQFCQCLCAGFRGDKIGGNQIDVFFGLFKGVLQAVGNRRFAAVPVQPFVGIVAD